MGMTAATPATTRITAPGEESERRRGREKTVGTAPASPRARNTRVAPEKAVVALRKRTKIALRATTARSASPTAGVSASPTALATPARGALIHVVEICEAAPDGAAGSGLTGN